MAVTFLRTTPDLVEQVREPFLNPDAPSGTGGQAGQVTAVSSVTIAGPFNASGAGDTPSRRRIFDVHADDAGAGAALREDDPVDAGATRLPRHRDSRRRSTSSPRFYDQGRRDGGSFDAGIELALRRLLVSPEFLYRIETDPASSAPVAAGGVYRINDLRARLAAVVLPVEQHTGRRAARGRSEWELAHGGRPSDPGAAHDRGSEVRDVWPATSAASGC